MIVFQTGHFYIFDRKSFVNCLWRCLQQNAKDHSNYYVICDKINFVIALNYALISAARSLTSIVIQQLALQSSFCSANRRPHRLLSMNSNQTGIGRYSDFSNISENKNEVFVPTDEPHGQIEGTVAR